MVVELKNRNGPALPDTFERTSLLDLCSNWMHKLGFPYSELFYADHISWDPDTEQFTLVFFDRILVLSDGQVEEDALEVEPD